VVVAAAVVFVGTGSTFRARAVQSQESPTEPLLGACPKQPPQPLPGNALVGATLAALAEAPAIYRNLNLEAMRATEVILGDDDPARGGYAGLNCGHLVQSRTVVVYLEFPALLPSASLSQGVVLVSRFSGGYRVWSELH
jgi:hypothetical protein